MKKFYLFLSLLLFTTPAFAKISIVVRSYIPGQLGAYFGPSKTFELKKDPQVFKWRVKKWHLHKFGGHYVIRSNVRFEMRASRATFTDDYGVEHDALKIELAEINKDVGRTRRYEEYVRIGGRGFFGIWNENILQTDIGVSEENIWD